MRDYATRARDGVPELLDALGAMFRRHLVLVSYQTWSVDPAGAAVVVDQAVGFADMVGSTEEVASFDVRRLAEMVEAFERHSWDTVTGAGGPVVKLIGDEVMFVHADAGAACGIANELIEHSRHHVRVGIAHGSMVAMHGDFYGAVVNLAARLVAQAGPDEVIVSEAARQASPGRMFEPFDVGALKGFVLPTQAFRLVV